MGTGRRKKRQRVDPTDDWEQLQLLCVWEEQKEYERIRPLVLFGDPVPERSRETGSSERTLYRKMAAFRDEGMESLFGSPKTRRRVLPPAIRRAIVDLKAEHPPLRLEEIANICGVLFGRGPDSHTVKAVLQESAIPRKLVRRFDPYREIPNVKERRKAVVTLHREGWADKSIARYLRMDCSTVYRVRKRFEERGGPRRQIRRPPEGRTKGGPEGDGRGPPPAGELRAWGVQGPGGTGADGHTSEPPHRGQDLKANREAEGLEKPSRGRKVKREMPFEAGYSHGIWISDVRYVDHSLPGTGNVYVISILENYSRAILARAVTLSQDTGAYLSVLYAAIERYGSPKTTVTDGGGIFRSRQSTAVYEALGLHKEEIERRQPWQGFIETTFNIQRRMADYYFAKAESFEEVVQEHDRWLDGYNIQRHWAHEDREDGRRSPSEVLGWVTGVRYHPVDLQKAFFSARFTRKLDALGYARLKHWRIYGEEGLARCEVAL